MSQNKHCTHCGGELGPGYVVQRVGLQTEPIVWHAGEPQRGLLGLKMQYSKQRAVHAWCCQDCGHLELFVDRPESAMKADSNQAAEKSP